MFSKVTYSTVMSEEENYVLCDNYLSYKEHVEKQNKMIEIKNNLIDEMLRLIYV